MPTSTCRPRTTRHHRHHIPVNLPAVHVGNGGRCLLVGAKRYERKPLGHAGRELVQIDGTHAAKGSKDFAKMLPVHFASQIADIDFARSHCSTRCRSRRCC